MKISFIVTYYNQEAHVRKSLDSIFAQNLPCDFEILVGDDGSTDGTVAIVREYVDAHPGVVQLFTMDRGENSKLVPSYRASDNRLNALRHARGRYFMLLDGDDYYNELVSIVDGIEILEKNSTLVGCAYDYAIRSRGLEKIYSQKFAEGLLNVKNFVAHEYIPVGAFIFRNVLGESEFEIFRRKKILNDDIMTVYMLQFGDFFYIKKPLYVYNQVLCSIWNAAGEVERKLISSMQLKLSMDTVPVFAEQSLLRFIKAFSITYGNRKILKKALGES
jgi:glycosyltransferase involved in cell wall biosynthesis